MRYIERRGLLVPRCGGPLPLRHLYPCRDRFRSWPVEERSRLGPAAMRRCARYAERAGRRARLVTGEAHAGHRPRAASARGHAASAAHLSRPRVLAGLPRPTSPGLRLWRARPLAPDLGLSARPGSPVPAQEAVRGPPSGSSSRRSRGGGERHGRGGRPAPSPRGPHAGRGAAHAALRHPARRRLHHRRVGRCSGGLGFHHSRSDAAHPLRRRGTA